MVYGQSSCARPIITWKDVHVALEVRLRLVEHKRKYPHLASLHDDALLVDPERMLAKRPKLGESG